MVKSFYDERKLGKSSYLFPGQEQHQYFSPSDEIGVNFIIFMKIRDTVYVLDTKTNRIRKLRITKQAGSSNEDWVINFHR